MKKNILNDLTKRIKARKAPVGVIGLGYVGLPLAITFADKGFNVLGIDINEIRIRQIRKGKSYISDVTDSKLRNTLRRKKFNVTGDFSAIQRLDVVIICVPTPLVRKPARGISGRGMKKPDMSYIRKAVMKVRKNMRRGQLVILESTTYPGTTREILLPILESTGFREGRDFYLAFSPERIDPGNKVYNTQNTPKVIGGISGESTKIARLLYTQAIKSVIPVSSANAAEMVKLLENTFRIVNTALVNEIATLCDKLNLDIWEIIKAAETKPYGYMAFYPGPGVGGHCIPVDPLYLSWKAKRYGFKTKFIDLASSVNEAMPRYVVKKLEKTFAEKKKKIRNCRILIVGVAYKKDVKDLRESPAISVIKLLTEKGARLSYYDEHFPYFKIDGIDMKPVCMNKNIIKRMDCVVLITDHSDINYKFLAKNAKLIFDTRNVFERHGIKSEKIVKL